MSAAIPSLHTIANDPRACRYGYGGQAAKVSRIARGCPGIPRPFLRIPSCDTTDGRQFSLGCYPKLDKLFGLLYSVDRMCLTHR